MYTYVRQVECLITQKHYLTSLQNKRYQTLQCQIFTYLQFSGMGMQKFIDTLCTNYYYTTGCMDSRAVKVKLRARDVTDLLGLQNCCWGSLFNWIINHGNIFSNCLYYASIHISLFPTHLLLQHINIVFHCFVCC